MTKDPLAALLPRKSCLKPTSEGASKNLVIHAYPVFSQRASSHDVQRIEQPLARPLES